MELKIYDNREEVTDALAEFIIIDISIKLEKQNHYSFVLAGGNSPQLLYDKIAIKSKGKIDWSRVYFFWGDERFVSFSDERSNAKMAFYHLLNKIPIDKKHIFKVNTDIDIDDSVEEYSNTVKKFLEINGSFDFVLLGVGADGHTLSIFPNTDLIKDTSSFVSKSYNQDQNTFRITLMPKIINAASIISFLVTGSEKADVVKRIFTGNDNVNQIPAKLIKAENGELFWFLDKEAASLIKDDDLKVRQ